MLPFLCDVLENLVRRLLRMFIKSKIVEDTVIAYDLTNIDEQKKENQISLEKVCLFVVSGEPRRVLIPFVRYGHPKKSTQIIFLQHF